MLMNKETAIIIGAGPAGLTAAYELLEKTDIKPVVFEMAEKIGGISKTVNYKGNRMDIGGHRFFSKSDEIMDWWLNILPLEDFPQPDPKTTDKVMLKRKRLSRVLFLRKFFDYPVSLNFNTFLNLGFIRICKIALSYIKAILFPRKENSLEDFFINRFGYELYSTFFKSYTQKVWGVPCSQIKPEWGAQRIKGLSVRKTIFNAVKKIFSKDSGLSQKETETSLIENFMYPKLGPGYLWEEVAKIVTEKGGQVNINQKIVKISSENNRIKSVFVKDSKTGEVKEYFADYFISSMPVKDLIKAMNEAPEEVKSTAEGLRYRDFITVGLLLNNLEKKLIDNWIYIQEKDIKMGRIQVFNNWSPYLVENQDNTWLGLEYFCNEGDELWNMTDEEFSGFAINELEKINIIKKENVLDSNVIRVLKAYPAYFGSYNDFDIIKNYVDKFENLFLAGRNGMHKYNNMDHSMLSSMEAVKNIINKKKAEEEYHETS